MGSNERRHARIVLVSAAAMSRWLLLATLALVVALSAWLTERLQRPASGTDRLSHTPDFYMEHFVTTAMDATGAPKHRLTARRMEHFPDTDANEFDKPYIIFYRPGGPPWHVVSERGWTSGNNEVMLFLGEVHIWREGGEGVRAVDVVTQDLRVLPDSEYAETDKPAVIRTPTTESRGVGMRVYMDESRLELLSKVRTVYESQSP